MALDRWFLTGAISEWWFSLIMCLKIQGFRTRREDGFEFGGVFDTGLTWVNGDRKVMCKKTKWEFGLSFVSALAETARWSLLSFLQAKRNNGNLQLAISQNSKEWVGLLDCHCFPEVQGSGKFSVVSRSPLVM